MICFPATLAFEPSCYIKFNGQYLCKEEVQAHPFLKEVPELLKSLKKSTITTFPKVCHLLTPQETISYLDRYTKQRKLLRSKYRKIRQKNYRDAEKIEHFVQAYTNIMLPCQKSVFDRTYPLINDAKDRIHFFLHHEILLTSKEKELFITYALEKQSCSYRNRLLSLEIASSDPLFADSQILSTLPLKPSESEELFFVGHTLKNQHVFRQLGAKGSHCTCMAMLLSDFFQKIINPKTIPLSENSALDRLGLFSSLEKSFNIAVKVKRLSNLNALAMALRTDGSAYLRIADSNRHIIVDAIDKQVATLRVPFHAWAITVPRAALRFALAPALAAPEREYDLKEKSFVVVQLRNRFTKEV